MTTDRHDITDTDVLAFVMAGCNAHEIAAFAGISHGCALARMAHALRTHARAA